MSDITNRLLREANEFDRLLHPRVPKVYRPSGFGLGAIGALAVSSIVNSARQISQHEKKFQKRNLSLLESYPDMAGQKRKSSNSDMVPVKRRRVNGNGLSGRTITAPIAGGVVVTRPRVPRIMSNSQSTFVTNTEHLVGVTMGTAGALVTDNYALIPTIPSWLGALSELYSKFRWVSLEAVYVPSCATTTPGNICMALQYDRVDVAPSSVSNLSQCYKAITFPPYAGYEGALSLSGRTSPEAVAIVLDTSRVDKKWYPTIPFATFTGVATDKQNQWCPASLIVASAAGPAISAIQGNIYLKYVVEFIEPISIAMNL